MNPPTPTRPPRLIDLRAEPAAGIARPPPPSLRAGGVVLVPTDTVYGLAALTPDAEEDLFVLKDRPADRSIAVLVADRQAAESLAESVPPAPLAELMDRHWPGPLTVVLPRPPTHRAHNSAATRGTVGVRCPDHPWLRRLLAEVGPLATTSANRHAEPTPTRRRPMCPHRPHPRRPAGALEASRSPWLSMAAPAPAKPPPSSLGSNGEVGDSPRRTA